MTNQSETYQLLGVVTKKLRYELDAVDRAAMLADMLHERDASFPPWEQLPAHTQQDLITAAKGAMEGSGE